ncbi:MAG TPA: hypothetical protein VNA25_00835 [Phycisphaerae bacterium]|nr:hypothetical protein [Phycisphaerae bacterium]
MGLVEAARRFDVGKGCRFTTYAVWGIRARVQRARHAEMKHAARRAGAARRRRGTCARRGNRRRRHRGEEPADRRQPAAGDLGGEEVPHAGD